MKYPEKEINHLLHWVKSELRRDDIPPWIFYQYMKLHEVLGTLEEGVNPLAKKEGLPESENHLAETLRERSTVIQLQVINEPPRKEGE